MKKILISIIVIIVFLISGGFYWFQWRPSEAKKECIQFVKSQVIKGDVSTNVGARFTYDFCLHDEGL